VRRIIAIGVAVAVVLVIAAMIVAPMLSVNSVEVEGASRVSADQVRQAANIRDGSSMLGVDTDAVAKQVAKLAPVASVDVSRSWPSTVTVEIVERKPIAWTRGQDNSVELVDATGVPFASAAKPPKGAVELRFPVDKNDPKTAAALGVYHSLSPKLKAKTTAIAANTPGDVQVLLRGGKTVKWGDESQAARKNAVIVALLTRDGKVYDVATPSMPTVQ
jgi:cell division protein FtsQ